MFIYFLVFFLYLKMNYMLHEKILENPNEHKSYHPKITWSVSLNIFFFTVLFYLKYLQAKDFKPETGNLETWYYWRREWGILKMIRETKDFKQGTGSLVNISKNVSQIKFLLEIIDTFALLVKCIHILQTKYILIRTNYFI